MDSIVTIHFKCPYHTALAHLCCVSCQRQGKVGKGRPHQCVWFEEYAESLQIKSFLICAQCYERVLAEYLDFCDYDWENVWFRFSDRSTRYKFDSRFQSND